MSFFKYAAKRATYDLMRAGLRDSVRSMNQGQASASESQRRALAGQFLSALSATPSGQIIGYVDAGGGDRRPVTPANFPDMLDIVQSGVLPMVIVENGREQILPMQALGAIRAALKARQRLDSVAPPANGPVIDGDPPVAALASPPTMAPGQDSKSRSAPGFKEGLIRTLTIGGLLACLIGGINWLTHLGDQPIADATTPPDVTAENTASETSADQPQLPLPSTIDDRPNYLEAGTPTCTAATDIVKYSADGSGDCGQALKGWVAFRWREGSTPEATKVRVLTHMGTWFDVFVYPQALSTDPTKAGLPN